MNSVYSKVSDSKAEEPKIGHLHGLIPLEHPTKHTKLILTQDDYYETYIGSSWTVSKQKNLLTNNTCLFVGSSMSDVFQMSIISQVRKSCYSEYSSYSWKCFALLCLGKLGPKDLASVYNYYFNKGISIIVVKEFKELPKKLLSLFE